MKKYKGIIILLFSVILIFSGCAKKELTYSEIMKKEVKYNPPIYTIDVSDTNLLMGIVDYAFVGRVESYVDTEYKFPVTNEETGKVSSVPYTNYMVTNLQNIKGELVLNEEIPIQKVGGIQEDGSYVECEDGDGLLEIGAEYIFLAYVREDGSMLLEGAHSNVLVSDMENNELETSQVYQKYIEAETAQVESDEDGDISTYDISLQTTDKS